MVTNGFDATRRIDFQMEFADAVGRRLGRHLVEDFHVRCVVDLREFGEIDAEAKPLDQAGK